MIKCLWIYSFLPSVIPPSSNTPYTLLPKHSLLPPMNEYEYEWMYRMTVQVRGYIGRRRIIKPIEFLLRATTEQTGVFPPSPNLRPSFQSFWDNIIPLIREYKKRSKWILIISIPAGSEATQLNPANNLLNHSTMDIIKEVLNQRRKPWTETGNPGLKYETLDWNMKPWTEIWNPGLK